MSARPHFSLAGIPVHIQPAFPIIAGLWGFQFAQSENLYIVAGTLQQGGLDVVALWILASFVSILVHELGHGFALKAFGHRSAIVLHGFGGVTISRRGSLSTARSIVVSAAGSITALVVLWLPARTVLGGDWIVEQPSAAIWFVYFLAFQNLWWSLLNLLPIRPLDGGNVLAAVVGRPAAARISVIASIAGAVVALLLGQGYVVFFALFLALNNWQEMRAARSGADIDVFEVDAPEVGPGQAGSPRRGRRKLAVVRDPAPASAPAMSAPDPARAEQLAWAALREGDVATASRLAAGLGGGANPYLRACVALAAGDPGAFELFEAAYVAQPSGPPNLVATELLGRTGAAVAVARRLVERADGRGRDGAATLQTHLHYADRFREAAEVGEVVYGAAPASHAQTAFEVACSWAKAGEAERAADWLDRAADAGFRAATVVDGEPDLAAVRALPRWPVLRARLA